MLEHLDIRNFALIDNLSIDFSDGFNVITGETGSGKSIILGALELILGDKPSVTSIRSGCDELIVNAVFLVPEGHEVLSELDKIGLEPENDRIFIRRVLKSNGRSSSFIQGQMVRSSDLTLCTELLLDMHGQSSHMSLLSHENQRKILDSYAGCNSLVNEVSVLSRKISETSEKIVELEVEAANALKQRDYLEFALNEINDAAIKENEDTKLEEKIRVFSNHGKIFESLTIASDSLKDANNSLYDVVNSLKKVSNTDSRIAEFSENSNTLEINTQELLSSIKEYLTGFDFSEDSVDLMQSRLSLLQRLKRKYGPTLQDVISFAQKTSESLNTLVSYEDELENLKKMLSSFKEEYSHKAGLLHDNRVKKAAVLEKKIVEVLKSLGMPNAVFCINITKDEEKQNSCPIHGFDNVAYLISANPGVSVKEIKEIASGGELSRVMLAIKKVLCESDNILTQVFDEIDSGIGGTVALSLASCICELALEKQLIVVTHLASIASRANAHFVVSKYVKDKMTFTRLVQVCDETRVHEIARMLGGNESDISLEHARSMIKCQN